VVPAADLTDTQVQEQLGHVRPTVTTTYDAAGQVLSEANPVSTTAFRYDDLGNRTAVIDGANVLAERRFTVSRYDVAGNRVFTWDAKNVQTAYQYDALNHPTVTIQGANLDPAQQLRTTVTYFAVDQVLYRRSPLGTLAYEYDRLGRQRQTKEVNGRDNPRLTQFSFDAANNRTEVLNHVTGTYINSLGQPTSFTLDDRTTSAYDPLN